jgi:hypothetical protein
LRNSYADTNTNTNASAYGDANTDSYTAAHASGAI